MARRLPLITLMAMIPFLHAACATYGRVDNQPYTTLDPAQAYAMHQAVRLQDTNSITLVLAFSGGHSRGGPGLRRFGGFAGHRHSCEWPIHSAVG